MKKAAQTVAFTAFCRPQTLNSYRPQLFLSLSCEGRSYTLYARVPYTLCACTVLVSVVG